MSTRFFTNEGENTLLKKFAGVFAHNPDIERACAFAYDDSGFFSNDKTTICAADNPRFPCAVLNSSVIWWGIRQIAAERQNGYCEFKPMYVNRLPIPVASESEQVELSGLVDRVLVAKRTGEEATVAGLEAEIDSRVYPLYGLTAEEIKIVVGAGGAK